MRIKFKKSDLVQAANIVQSVANPQSTLPILANVLINTEHDNVITLSATDYETRVKIHVPGEVEKKGMATVPAKTFSDLVRELPDDGDVTLEFKAGGIHIKCRDIRAELQAMPARDFPKWPEVETKNAIQLQQKELKRLVEKILFAVPVRDPRKVLLGCLCEIKKGKATCVATDGKILAYYAIPLEGQKISSDHNVVIPHKLLDELSKNLGDEGTASLSFDERQISVEFNNVTYISNQIEGKYPNYEAVVPKEFARELRFQRPAMVSAVRRTSILTDIKQSAVMMTFDGDTVTVEAESYDRGRIHEEIPGVNEGEPFKIVFSHKYVADMLKALDKDEVILQVNTPTTPAVFRSADSPDNFYLIMPIKMTEIREYDDEGGAPGRKPVPDDDEPQMEDEE